MVIRSQAMTAEDFLAYAGQHPETRFDFIDGELVEVAPKPLHGWLQVRAIRLLGNWLDDHPIGHLHSEVLHVLDGVKFIPDISINRALANDASYFTEPPLLAIEIREDTQSREAQRRKARQYIAHGTPLVLLLMPDEQIEVFTADGGDDPRIYGMDDLIENLPGFEGLTVAVKDILAR